MQIIPVAVLAVAIAVTPVEVSGDFLGFLAALLGTVLGLIGGLLG